MKKLLLSFCMLLSALGSWAHDFELNGIYYKITSSTDLTVAVTYRGDKYDSYSNEYTGSVTIPETVTYNEKNYSVTSIDGTAFRDCSGLTSVSIPNSVTLIGWFAFENTAWYDNQPDGLVYAGKVAYKYKGAMPANTEIILEEGTLGIGASAFSGCTGLTSVTIPNSVTSIGSWAFQDCMGLTSITIPNSVTYIRDGTFLNTALISITIPNSVTTIGNSAFDDCTSLTSVTIPESVTSIGWRAFANTAWLDNQPNGLVYAGKVAYQYKGMMPENTEIILEDGTLGIAGDAFANCSGLTSITIPNSVISIGEETFYNCSGLTSITIPNSVTSIGNYAFQNCSGLTSVTIPNSVTSIGFSAFESCTGLTYITIPNSVTSIGGSAFKGCSGLTSITIPNITSIDAEVFSNCTGFTSVTIPNSVTYIGNGAFYGCSGLTSVTIPNSVTSIGNSAFNGCTGLSSANIPNSVTNIGKDAFKDCTGLTKAEFSSIESLCGINFGNADANPLKNAHHLYISGEEIKKVNIPNSITSIKQYAFYGCTDINAVNIPSSVTAIGDYAFAECSGLKFITCDSKTPPTAYNNSFPSAIALVPVDAQNEYKNATGWKNLIFNQAFTLLATTQTTITLQTSELIKEQSVRLSDDKVFTGTSDIIRITGLRPATRYTLRASGRYEDTTLENTIVATTKSINVSVEASVTNTTINLKSNYDAGDATVSYARFDGFDEGNEITITGLDPGVSRTIYFRVGTEDGSEFMSGGTYTTQKITAGGKVLARTASSVTLKGTLTGWIDANIINIGFRDNDYKSDEVKITGLRPDYSDTRRFLADFGNGYYSEYYISFKTNELTLETQQPKVISEGNVIVAAKSNLDDDETNVGFEWRRQDWTDDFDSKTGGAYLYNGEMEGYIRNINSNYLWKFRPYYEANDGTRYYGEWKGLDPSDYSYFEPTVHTYASVTVNENTAEVKGYAQRGTDNVTSQGFLYWPSSTANVKAEQPMRVTDVPSDALKVTAKGTVMNAKLTDLLYNTTYSYVAFVETSEGETFYGEEMTFQTGEDLTGIVDVNDSGNVNNNTSNIYDLSGRKLSRMQKGINIIRMSNGTVRKVLVK